MISINKGGKSSPHWLGALVLAGLGLAGALAAGSRDAVAGRLPTPDASAKDAKVKGALSRLPLSFEVNQGQADGKVKFLSRGSGYTFFLSPKESALALAPMAEAYRGGGPVPGPVLSTMLRMRLVGGNPSPKLVGEEKLRARSNYFIGNNPKRWHQDVPNFGKVRYDEVYPGIDVVYYGNQQELEHDFIVSPGADPAKIRMGYRGVKDISIDADGELLLHTANGVVQQKKPFAYQMVNGQRQQVIARYAVRNGREVAFELGGYDPAKTLVIDPVIRYSRYIGGSIDDYGWSMVLDSDNTAYITGYTGSFAQDSNGEANKPFVRNINAYPTVNPLQGDPDRSETRGSIFADNADETRIYCSAYDAFISKVDQTGNLVYSTYLGAEADDFGQSIAVDAQKNIYVTGMTRSSFWPVVLPRQSDNGGGSGEDAFVVKLNPAGNQLRYSTYLGGSGSDRGRAIAVDGLGNAYVAGVTTSTNFPVSSTAGQGAVYQQNKGDSAGFTDAFLTSLNATGSAFNYSTYFGGNGDETGVPASLTPNLNYQNPGTPFANRSSDNGGPDGLFCGPRSTALGQDFGIGLAVSSGGFAYLTGGTTSTDLATTPGAVQAGKTADGNLLDAFVAEFEPDGLIRGTNKDGSFVRPGGATTRGYVTYLGGNGDDAGRGIAVDTSGFVYVTGFTTSSDFDVQAPPAPTAVGSPGAFLGTNQGGVDAFVTKLAPGGGFGITGTTYSTYLGGSGTDIGNSIAVSASNLAHVTGSTASPTNFPTRDAIQSGSNGGIDMFATKYLLDGSDYEFSTYLGGSSTERGMAIAVDSRGQAYIAGMTNSGALLSTGGYALLGDVFMLKLHSPPAAPSNLAVTDRTTTTVTLSWVDNSDNEESFEIERKPNLAGQDVFGVVGSVGSNNRTYTDQNLIPGTTYVYRVRGVNSDSSGNTFFGAYSNQVSVDTLPEPPAPPINLTVTPLNQNTLRVSFVDDSNNEKGFNLEGRRVTAPSTSFVEIIRPNKTPATPPTFEASPGKGQTVSIDVTSLPTTPAATPIEPNKTYEFRVRSFNDAGPSAFVGPVAATTPPPAPTTAPVLALDRVTNSQVDLKWTYTVTPNDALGFKIFRRTPGGTFTVIRTLSDPAARTYSDTGLGANSTFEYVVRAYNASGDGPDSNVVSATTLSDPPAAATDLKAAFLAPNTIRLTWKDNSLDETGFKIYRSTNGFSTPAGAPIFITGPGEQMFDDTPVRGNVTYSYRVVAFKTTGAGDSEALNPPEANLLTPPEAPGTLTATPFSQTEIDLAWTDNSANPTPFQIERSMDGATNWQVLVTTVAGTTTARDSGLQPNTRYFYRVRGKNGSTVDLGGGPGFGPYSNIASATTKKFAPPAPTGLTATAVSGDQVDLKWEDNSTPATQEDGFRIERKVNSGGFAPLATVGADVTTYQDKGLTPNTTYTYRVVAFNSGGDSPASREAGATPRIPPVAPSSLTVTPASESQLVLTWTHDGANATRYIVERKQGAAFVEVGRVPVGTNTFTDNNLGSNSTYTYRVKATNDLQDSPPSNEQAGLTLPAAPTSLLAVAVSQSQIDLTWTDNSTVPSQFRLEAKSGNGGYVEIGSNITGNKASSTGLAPDTTYTFRVRATNASGNSAYSNEATATTLPQVPATVTGLAVNTPPAPDGSTKLVLTWTDASNNEAGFKIERSTDGGANFSALTTVGAGVAAYTDTGLAGNTSYTYRVKAFNAGGDAPASNNATGRTLANPPAAPTSLVVTTLPAPDGTTKLALAWSDNSGDETGFKIQRSNDNGATWMQIASVGPDVTTATDIGLTGNSSYSYRVVAFNAGGDSGFSNVAVGTTLPNPPASPTGLRLTVMSQTSVKLDWTDNSVSETGFRIERKSGNGQFTQVGTVAAGVATFTDTNLTAGTVYTYRVVAMNTGGDSGPSNEETATTQPNPPTSPSGLSAVGVSSSQINLTFTDNSNNETGFKVERSTDGGTTFSEIGAAAPNATTFADTGLLADKTYHYRVRGTNAGGDSSYSNVTSANTLPAPPQGPTSLSVSPISQTSVRLTWTDVSTGETGFKIERSLDGTTFNQVATIGANQTGFTDTGLAAGTTYFYRVRSTGTGGDSAFSNTASGATLPNAPAAPNGLTATVQSRTSIRLTWTDGSNNETGFVVERSDDDGVSFGSIGTVGADITSFTDSGLTPGKTYLYRIRSTNVGGESASSNVATATTSGNPPTAPTGVTVEAPAEGGEGRLIVRWVDNSGDETGFRIERKSGSEEFIVVGTVGAGATTFEDTGLSGDTTYTYRVVATNGGGASEASSEAANSTLADPPTNLQATIVNDRNVRLTWTNSGGTGVRIERRLGAGTFSQIGSVGSGVEFFTDSSLSTGATATYRLRTTNRGGSSRVSEEVTVATTPSLASVTLSSASIQGGKTIRGTVSLTAAATQSVTVTITSGDKASATTDRTSVTIARGSRTATFSVRTKRIRTTKNVTISARAGSVTRTATFEVIGSRGGGGGGGGTTPRR